MTTIISIDPGYDRIGVAILKKEPGGQETLVESVCIETDRSTDMDSRIFAACAKIDTLIKKHQTTVMAIENLFMMNNKTTAMGVSEARGAFKYVGHSHGLVIHEFTPLQIKTAVTGYGKSTKDQVEMMVGKLVTLPDRKLLDDEVDAIAVGLTYFAMEQYLKNQATHL